MTLLSAFNANCPVNVVTPRVLAYLPEAGESCLVLFWHGSPLLLFGTEASKTNSKGTECTQQH